MLDQMQTMQSLFEQLGLPSPSAAKPASAELSPDADARSVAIVVKNPNGIHVRPDTVTARIAAVDLNDGSLLLGRGRAAHFRAVRSQARTPPVIPASFPTYSTPAGIFPRWYSVMQRALPPPM